MITPRQRKNCIIKLTTEEVNLLHGEKETELTLTAISVGYVASHIGHMGDPVTAPAQALESLPARTWAVVPCRVEKASGPQDSLLWPENQLEADLSWGLEELPPHPQNHDTAASCHLPGINAFSLLPLVLASPGLSLWSPVIIVLKKISVGCLHYVLDAFKLPTREENK